MTKSSEKAALLILLLVTVGAGRASASGPGPGPCEPVCAKAGMVHEFEGLRSEGVESSFGYHFTVSPDEQWLAQFTASPGSMRLVHAPTGKAWIVALPADLRETRWAPGCFTPGALHQGPYVVDLNPQSPVLQFRRAAPATGPATAQPPGTFLGSPQVLRDRSGAAVRGWDQLNAQDGEQGEMTWSRDGRTLYEVHHPAADRDDLLFITPPGKASAVDSAIVHDYEEQERRSAIQAMAKHDPSLPIAELEKLMKGGAGGGMKLDQLCLSPDGRYLAAIASTARPASASTAPRTASSSRCAPASSKPTCSQSMFQARSSGQTTPAASTFLRNRSPAAATAPCTGWISTTSEGPCSATLRRGSRSAPPVRAAASCDYPSDYSLRRESLPDP
jgi:hypothetical protein